MLRKIQDSQNATRVDADNKISCRLKTKHQTSSAIPIIMRNHQWSLSLPNNGESARAIVVLIGWWGAEPPQMEKYAAIYTDMQCATLTGVANNRAILTKDDEALRQYAQKGLIDVSRLLQENNKLPVIFHMFSNGGGFVWEQMERLLEHPDNQNYLHSNQSGEKIDTEATPLHSNTNLSLVRKNVRGQIFDSCPVYPTMKTAMAVLELSGIAKQSLLLLVVLKVRMLIFFVLESMRNFVCRKNHRLIGYWNQLLNSDLCGHQAFIYSTSDTATDPSHLQEFIATRQQQPDAKISVLKLQDSEHVQHFRQHPYLYTQFVQKFVRELLQQPTV
jgi:hypothetical protein